MTIDQDAETVRNVFPEGLSKNRAEFDAALDRILARLRLLEFAEPKEYANAKRAEARIIELEFDYRTDMTAQALRIAELEEGLRRIADTPQKPSTAAYIARSLLGDAERV